MIQYYIEKVVTNMLLDATKAFDKVSYKVLFDLLQEKRYALELLTYYITCIVTNNAM